MSRAATLLAALVLVGPTGCPAEIGEQLVELYPVTAAPPARTATIVDEEAELAGGLDVHAITLSSGVVLGVSCWESCEGTCVDPDFQVADPEILSIRPLFRQTGGTPAWALWGSRPGRTQLTVRTACASRTYAVTVLDPTP